MQLFDILMKQYGEDEPIFLAEVRIEGMSDSNLRQQIKKLTDSGKLKRFDTGIYYIPAKSVFQSGSMLSMETVLEKKYLKDGDRTCGYFSGLLFANQMGLTTQVPAVYDIATNKATSEYRETSLADTRIILRRPRAEITSENYRILQFLDLLKDIDVIAELEGDARKKRLFCYMQAMAFSFAQAEPYLKYYPDKIYRNMYETGVLNGVSA